MDAVVNREWHEQRLTLTNSPQSPSVTSVSTTFDTKIEIHWPNPNAQIRLSGCACEREAYASSSIGPASSSCRVLHVFTTY
jgi:hypothetical protein